MDGRWCLGSVHQHLVSPVPGLRWGVLNDTRALARGVLSTHLMSSTQVGHSVRIVLLSVTDGLKLLP